VPEAEIRLATVLVQAHEEQSIAAAIEAALALRLRFFIEKIPATIIARAAGVSTEHLSASQSRHRVTDEESCILLRV
jgi:hypothetical protein